MKRGDKISLGNKHVHVRIKNMYILLFVLSFLIIFSAVRWQVVRGSEFREIANSRVYTSDLRSLRGTIYSADGTALAYSEPRFNMFLWYPDLEFFEKQEIQSIDEFVDKVAPIIDTTPEALRNLIDELDEAGVQWMPIAEELTEEQWRTIINLNTDLSDSIPLRGFQFERTEQRIYPEGQLAAHVIGLTQTYNNRTYGISGVEESWEGDLSPTNGLVIRENDASGRAVASALVPTIEPRPGSEVYTSINKKLQSVVEEELKDVVERYESESGSVVIMDPKTGEIMALANFPTYNPNFREEDTEGVYGNSALLEPIEIGSVMKAVTAAAAIDLGVVDQNSVVLPDGHGGCKDYEEFGDDLDGICTWNKAPQPAMPLYECFRKSDNICFYEVARLLEREDFKTYLELFGIGRVTGADLGSESNGYFKNDILSWNEGDVSAYSYGHGYSVNMLQATSAMSVFPNKGVRMKPRVVNTVIKSDGTVKNQEPEAIETVISANTAQAVSNMMMNNFQNEVVESYFQHLKRYPIGWKTGSALIADPNNPLCPYCSGDLNTALVGFDASDDASFVMLLKLERPKGGQLSFFNVRPGWLQIFDATKEILGVRPG